MSGRGARKRGRPPKTQTTERASKFNYQLLKKPKYLTKGSDSQFSTPSVSRASSPQGSDASRRSISRPSASKSNSARGRGRRGGASNSFNTSSSYARKGYESEYHYGSDFGDSTDKSDADDDLLQLSPSEDESVENENESDSDYSINSFGAAPNGVGRPPRPPSPDPVWLQDREVPTLELPPSSEDLLLSREYTLKAATVYEVLRRFRILVRLSPFRFEDFCGALVCEEQTPLLAEIHIMLLKAILREEDIQATHFGPLDQKDSVNITLYLMDNITWPEVMRSYIESDTILDRNVLDILSTREYPFSGVADRLTILQFLTDQFLITTSVRDDMLQEGPIHYDDHCRICHRLGKLLCCETCPAVFHLECVDPPLIDVPNEDWQCSICKAHKVIGVMDCISTHEKQGMLVRQDCLGYDRHGRKFWYVGRRVFVEDQDSKEIWYYSTVEQFNYLLSKLDDKDLEMSLCRELNDMRDEIYRQMRITERLTNENKGNKKSYFEIECERLEKLNGDNHTEERKSSRDSDLDMESGAENDVNKNAVERKSSTGSSDADLRMTRHKLNQLSSGTLYFKLGMENDFKAYVNQYTTNPIALNKPQRNEDRDKKRHLSHKFSLTTASEFKWTGLSNGTEANVVTTLRQTLLMLEQSIASSYMNPNWQTLRKSWVAAVTTCSKAADFVCVLIVLQACFKSVVFANVWHEQLGHIKLQRITSNEREEKKKLEKREKRERDDEEERNRLAFNYVKYSLGLKHQVWKQKGEEYRIHGQWGWIWMSYTRRSVRRGRVLDKITPSKIMMRVKKDDIERVISVDRKTELILKRLNENSKPQDLMTYSDFKEVEVLPVTQSFEQIDVSKALTTPGRLLYPKVARKSKLDDFLNRRIKLKEKEAEKFAASEKKEDDIDVVNDTTPTPHEPKQSASQTAAAAPPPPPPQPYLEKELMRLSSGTKVSPTSNINLELVNALAKKIQICRHQFGIHNRFAKPYRCYAKGCNTNSNSVSQINQATCYSPLCLQKARSKKELLFLLRKAHTAGNGSKETVAAILGAVKKPSILEQKLMEGKNNSNFNADDSEDGRNCDDTPVDVEQDFKNAMANSFGCEESLILSCVKLSKDEIKKESAFDIVKNETIKTEEIKTESENDNAMQIDNHEIESEVTVKTETDSSNGKRPCLEDGIIDVDSNPAPSVDVESSESLADFLDEDSSGKRSRKSSRRSTRSVNLDTSGQSKNGSKKDLTIEKQSVDVACINEKPIFVPKPNRRFPTGGKVMKKEEKCKFEKEMAPNGSERIYTAISPRGKVYLQQLKVESKQIAKLPPQKSYKFPIIANFNSHKAIKSIMMLPRFELLKLARHGGKMSVSGHHHLAKNNMSVWPYPCSRPLFKTCWLFRMSSLRTLSAVALQFRILWCCLRWDDMVTKPPTADGKHQITTETEIVTLELLKHRHVGKFSEKTQYLRRKVVIPLELPKTIREVTSIRSGLRKRKRAESPQQTEPQVTEEWVDEEKLELWEIKLFGEKQEKTVTRTVTGKLPPQRQQIDASSTSSGSHSHSNTKTIVVGPKATPEEIKEKMEHQLRLQRAAHNQKRQQQESKQGTTPKPNIIGNRRVIVKNPDGTTRIIHQTISAPTPKPSPAVVEQATTTQSSPAPQTPQHKVQIIRGPDGKVSVRGLNPGQQLIQMPDGKLHVLTTTPGAATKTVALKPTGTPTQTKTIVATAAKPQAVTPVANRQQVVVKQIVKPAEMKKIVTQKIVTGTQNQIVAQNVSQKAVQQVSSTTGQKIITSTGQIVSSSSGQKIITSTGNIQHLLVQACQKVVGSNVPVQKVLISPPQQQQQQQQQQQPVQQQIIVQNSPTAQPQQQFIINQQGQKVIQQLVTTGNQQQVIQRILLSPGQRLVTTQQPQTSQQVQVLQQHIIQPPQQQQQMVQPQVVVQQQQIQTQQVVQKVVQRQQPQLVQQQQQAAQQQQQQQQQAAQQQQQQQNQQQQQASNHQQVVVQNSALAQQLAQGKLQVAHVNGQQVIIRPLGNNQAQIVAHIKTQSDGSAHIVTNTNFTETEATPEVQSPQKVVVRQQQVQVSSPESVQQKIQQQPQQQQQQQQQHQQIQQQQIVQQSSGIAPAVEQSLLQGQPPGTVIKCVTAQVIQTDHGPRIVLQGLAGNDFTQHQLALVQQQVKQQLLKAQESSGKQGVLGPTKIYLAVQPSAAGQQTTQAQPPPLAPVQSSPQQQQVTSTTPMLSPTNKTDDVQKQKVNGAQLNPDVKKEILQKVLVANIQKKAALQQQQQQNQLHLQQTEDGININTENLTFATGKSDQSFVITPDYIQQTIKNALKQENLNPEIEEKLLNLQRYQERQMKSEVINNPTVTVQNHIAVAATSAPPSPIKSNSARKRPNNRTNDDDDWILETPRRRPPRVSTSSTSEKRFGGNEMHTMTGGSAISRLSFSEDGEDVAPPQPPPMNNRRLAAIKREGDKKKQNYQLTHRLYRHKELLKKDILKKRNLLEKELQIEIQKELATELSIRAKMERIKQEDYKNSENTPSHKKKSPSKQSTSHNAQETTTTPATNRTCATSSSNPGRNRKSSKSLGSSGSGSSRKKEKLYCICRTPYDDTKFYVGCDLCNNWFHGDCVNITEEASKKLSEFICDECKHARETQELYCLCKQPYDESQFYICCDKCQDWFHGRCVGILQSEAEYIDEYICPNCQRNNSVNFANMKNLSQTEYDNLKKLIKQIQGHKNAWPFMEPVDPEEAPDYYKVIKEPMDLKKVDTKITTKVYSKLSEFIGDMTKIFDNCRYYNPKESSFYKCAESLEGYFVQKIKHFRENLVDQS